MQIANPKILTDFYSQPAYKSAEQPIRTWAKVVATAQWRMPMDVKRTFNSADILRDSRVIFDIGGNKYRVVAKINYPVGLMVVRFIGTHREYDKIDAQTI